MTDDIDLPSPPDNLDSFYGEEDAEIVNASDLQSQSPIALKLNFNIEDIQEADLSAYTNDPLERALMKAELADTNMYLKNIHSGFKSVRSTRSLINLVGAGLAVHKRRRDMLKDIKADRGDALEIDEHGNIKGQKL